MFFVCFPRVLCMRRVSIGTARRSCTSGADTIYSIKHAGSIQLKARRILCERARTHAESVPLALSLHQRRARRRCFPPLRISRASCHFLTLNLYHPCERARALTAAGVAFVRFNIIAPRSLSLSLAPYLLPLHNARDERSGLIELMPGYVCGSRILTYFVGNRNFAAKLICWMNFGLLFSPW